MTILSRVLTALLAPLVAVVAATAITSVVIAMSGSSPAEFWAIIVTSTPAGGVIPPKWMLKPCANISVLPAVMCGAISLL